MIFAEILGALFGITPCDLTLKSVFALTKTRSGFQIFLGPNNYGVRVSGEVAKEIGVKIVSWKVSQTSKERKNVAFG